MSVRSHFEINHDVLDLKVPDKVLADALRAYVRSAGREQADVLKDLGITRFWWGHHSGPEVTSASFAKVAGEALTDVMHLDSTLSCGSNSCPHKHSGQGTNGPCRCYPPDHKHRRYVYAVTRLVKGLSGKT